MKYYAVNQYSVLFHNYFDQYNQYRIFVFDEKQKSLLRLNHKGYAVLHCIFKNPRVTVERIHKILLKEKMEVSLTDLKTFLQECEDKHLIITSKKQLTVSQLF